MFGMSPPMRPAGLQTVGAQYHPIFPAYEQPMPQPTPYGGIGFGLSGMQNHGESMSMMGHPHGQTSRPSAGLPNPMTSMGMGSGGFGRGGIGGAGIHGLGGMSTMGGMTPMSNMTNMTGMTGAVYGRPGLVPNGMYNPYMSGWGMGGMNPYMMMGQHPMGVTSPGAGPTPGPGQGMGMGMGMGQGMGGEGVMQAFDPGKMKQGRQGHYGYLEGRELAGPPVGYLPAGVPPTLHKSPSHSSPPPTAQQQPVYPASVAPSQPQTSWGDSTVRPRARYDGAPTVAQYVKADLDTPYPRIPNAGAASAWTKYGEDKTPMGNGMGIDGRMGINHRRLREGKV
ncbi:hypothetical protein M231_01663 [Tremella mesenterica]|uniref:Uncharacterized protein n=1 Tax=Tremella mesenterica TaxID=5217 RepID=A0A4Q1BT05_TREME|nr:hypothetical protein M231_01663 [Tremella mesenterica]